MKIRTLILIQFIKSVLSVSKPKARHQKLTRHELVNYEFICEGNCSHSMTYIKRWKLGQTLCLQFEVRR